MSSEHSTAPFRIRPPKRGDVRAKADLTNEQRTVASRLVNDGTRDGWAILERAAEIVPDWSVADVTTVLRATNREHAARYVLGALCSQGVTDVMRQNLAEVA
ncbi:hypothetical protein [Bradyrhizobium guangdongense]